MAMILAREYELITLWVRLNARRGAPAITASLEATVNGAREVLFEAGPYPADAFGMPGGRRTLSETTMGVADELVRELAAWNAAENNERRPLWLCLVQPYGHLGMIPWEADLVPALDVPVLRLPDFIEPRRETASALDVAVVSSVPEGVGKGEIGVPELETVVRSLLQSTSERRVQVHVFAAEEAARSLGPDLVETVVLHTSRPKTKRRAARTPANPWFEWIEESLAGQALDAVHFLAHGVLGSSGGMLALGQVPGDDAAPPAVHTNAGQLSEFLTRIGAWSTAFHLPLRYESDLGLRHLADALGALRAGAVLFHDSSTGPDVLDSLTRMLYGPATQPAPVSNGYFAFIQPRQVEAAGGSGARRRRGGTNMNATWEQDVPDAYATIFEQESVPSYVAATERIGDQAQVLLARGYDNIGGAPLGDEESEALTRAMGALKSVVANYAVETQEKASRARNRKKKRA